MTEAWTIRLQNMSFIRSKEVPRRPKNLGIGLVPDNGPFWGLLSSFD